MPGPRPRAGRSWRSPRRSRRRDRLPAAPARNLRREVRSLFRLALDAVGVCPCPRVGVAVLQQLPYGRELAAVAWPVGHDPGAESHPHGHDRVLPGPSFPGPPRRSDDGLQRGGFAAAALQPDMYWRRFRAGHAAVGKTLAVAAPEVAEVSCWAWRARWRSWSAREVNLPQRSSRRVRAENHSSAMSSQDACLGV